MQPLPPEVRQVELRWWLQCDGSSKLLSKEKLFRRLLQHHYRMLDRRSTYVEIIIFLNDSPKPYDSPIVLAALLFYKWQLACETRCHNGQQSVLVLQVNDTLKLVAGHPPTNQLLGKQKERLNAGFTYVPIYDYLIKFIIYRVRVRERHSIVFFNIHYVGTLITTR